MKRRSCVGVLKESKGDLGMKRYVYFIMVLVIIFMLSSCKRGDGENPSGHLELELLELQEGEGDGGASKESHLESLEQEREPSIFVHVAGAIHQPGVVELKGNKRVFEAIDLAGGLREDAAINYINLARVVEDGERIYVPNLEEIEELKSGLVDPNLFLEKFDSNSSLESSGKVNINQAGINELMTLTGIGPSKARSIIDYREQHGGFGSVEELLNVSGIGTSTYERIREHLVL